MGSTKAGHPEEIAEARRLIAILALAADIAGYGRLASADEVVKQTGDGILIEASCVCHRGARGMIEPNSGWPPERRIEFRVSRSETAI